jgi:hypothetical protein
LEQTLNLIQIPSAVVQYDSKCRVAKNRKER